jgi:hypothetical protein
MMGGIPRKHFDRRTAMTVKATAAFAFALMLVGSSAVTADDAKLPDAKAFDKAVIDSLRAVHNKGAELYNTSRDYPAAYRLYQGALEAVKPLLAHRPAAQKLIEAGLAAAEKETDPTRRAFMLHETIEDVRRELKSANGLAKSDDKKPKDKVEVLPLPKPKDDTAKVSGFVTVAGNKPLVAGEITVVSLNLAVPRVFTAEVIRGEFKFAQPIPPGKYTAIVTGAGVPAKYELANTSGLMYEFAAGAIQIDIPLK